MIEVDSVSIHEAGHAVVAAILKVPIEEVTIIPFFYDDGSNLTGSTVMKGLKHDPVGLPLLESIENRLEVSYAGQIAESHFGFSVHDRSRIVTDERVRRRYLAWLQIRQSEFDDTQISLLEERALKRTASRFNAPNVALAVYTVAIHLHRDKTLLESRVQQLVRHALNRDVASATEWWNAYHKAENPKCDPEILPAEGAS